ncbi:MAG: DUF5117 domain-containing protein [Planctomycetota bacterium]|nr:DUF5117 domain-containing protein [Planctomycetota bacterium]
MFELLAITLTAAIYQNATPATNVSIPAWSMARGSGPNNELPPFDVVADGYDAVISSADGQTGFYTLYRDAEDNLLIELPSNFDGQLIMIAYTVASGITEAGVQMGDLYGYWTRIHDQLVLVQPNLETRTTGDSQSQQGYDRVFTDRVVLDVPILTEGPNGGPVINGTNLFLHGAGNFFGGASRGARSDLGVLAKAKSFPENVELSFDLPIMGGQFGTISYSIRTVPKDTGYEPRIADHRIGFFTTSFKDIGDPSNVDPWVRYVTRWHLEKADPSLKMSPPKQPVVFYLEHTIPVRYRRWVRDGVL